MKNKNSILMICILFAVSLSAQDKVSVGILSFTYIKGTVDKEIANTIQEEVTTAFVKAKRFDIVDRTKMDALSKEKNLQKQEDFINGKQIEQGKSIGAAFLVSGNVLSGRVEQTASKHANGSVKISYIAKLAIDLKVIDVATGQVIASDLIKPSSSSGLLGGIGELVGVNDSSPEVALSKALENISDKIDKFVAKYFPITFSIVEIQEKDAKGIPSKVLIAGGSLFNLQKGQKLKVVEISTINFNGKQMTRKEEIGEFKIITVDGENFSVCKATEGGTTINSKFEAKAKLVVITKE